MKKAVLILLSLVLLAAPSCKSEAVQTDVTDKNEEESVLVTEAETDAPEPEVMYYDPLTGLKCEEELSGKRCIALVVKNDRAASPQYGLSQAAITYEVSVEGGLTRFLAVYSDLYKMPEVAPIIDSRSYLYTLSQCHNAIFVQAGTSAFTRGIFKQNGIQVIDALACELEPSFRRDEKLKNERGSENSVLTDGNMLKNSISASKLTQDKETFKNHLEFSAKENTARTSGSPCSSVTIQYSTSHAPSFKYSTLDNEYKRYQYDAEHKDGASGEQLSYSNVIVMLADTYTADEQSGELGMLLQEGDGYLVSCGKYVKIKWSIGTGGEIRFLQEDGKSDVKLCPGKTFVSVCSTKIKDKVIFG